LDCQSFCQSVCLSGLFFRLSVCLFFFLSVCLSVSVCVYFVCNCICVQQRVTAGAAHSRERSTSLLCCQSRHFFGVACCCYIWCMAAYECMCYSMAAYQCLCHWRHITSCAMAANASVATSIHGGSIHEVWALTIRISYNKQNKQAGETVPVTSNAKVLDSLQ